MRQPNPALKTDWYVFVDAPANRYIVLRRDEYGRTERFGRAVPQGWEFDVAQAEAMADLLNSSV